MSQSSRKGEYKGDRTPAPDHAHIPAAYWTDLWEYHLAVVGHGEHAFKWSDKPHRLVYDLTRKLAEERMARSETGPSEDTKRLDWLEQQTDHKLIVDLVADWSYERKRYVEGMRAALDEAMRRSERPRHD